MSRPKQEERIATIEAKMGKLDTIEALLEQLVGKKAATIEPSFIVEPVGGKKAATEVDKYAKSRGNPLSYGQWRTLTIARHNAANVMTSANDAKLLRELDTYNYPVTQGDASAAISFAFVLRKAGKGTTLDQHREMAKMLLALHKVGLAKQQAGK